MSSNNNTVSFKVSLNQEVEGQSEVRRFVIDQDVSTSLTYLKEKLITIFPQLRRKDFNITWTDEDGDKVTIRSDDELVIALNEMNGPVYKLSIGVVLQEKPLSHDHHQQEASGNSEGEEHSGVTCDACDGPVVGFRYKCVVCTDYDLCGKCEAKGIHPGHNMIRIATPQGAWPHHFFRRLHRMHDKVQKKSGFYGCPRANSREPEKRSWESQPSANVPSGAENSFRFENGGSGRPRWGCSRARSLNPESQKWFDSIMKGWTGAEGEVNGSFQAAGDSMKEKHQAYHQMATAAAQAAHASAHAEAASRAASEAACHAEAAGHATGACKNPEQARPAPTFDEMVRNTLSSPNGTDFLKNIGQMVANALDPLGVDVLIDVETPSGQRVNVASKKAEETKIVPEEKVDETKTSQEPKTSSELEEALKDDDDQSDDDDSSTASSPDSKRDTLVGWTMVEGSPTTPNSREIPIQVMDTSIYPTLPANEVTPAVQVPAIQVPVVVPQAEPAEEAKENSEPKKVEQEPPRPEMAFHPDPRIQVALQAMLNMGFTNDGGWLTQLLETKQGDIGKVLDVLQPINPNRR